MSNNYPAGVTINTKTIDLECPRCEYAWSASVTIELGMISEDDYDTCPKCEVQTQ